MKTNARVLILRLYFPVDHGFNEDDIEADCIRGIDKMGMCVGDAEWDTVEYDNEEVEG